MRRARRLIGVAALAAAPVAGLSLSLVAAPVAAAHDQLVGSTPEEGGTVSTPLTSVELVFSAAIPGEFVQVAVTDASGATFQDGAPETVGDTVTQAVAQLPDGAYTIAYRVVSSDGHPIDGTVAFTVSGVGPAEPSTPSAPSSTAAGPPSTPSPTPSAETETPSDEATVSAGVDDTSSDDGGLGTTATVLLIAGGAVIVALLAFWAAGGRRRGTAEDTDS
ncbi:copper resistance CopC family protein [Jiangella mangrovi]|uniref:Methionine-rich copper-binding protein CopC n=1 Tax=Jiangella mangrovi TaxID=1524084 RepID=A0A7W9GPN0_9ACTN|nr:copper resistance CopC family protein [Jiangella mangrovi]MBB5787728.1 methionine-rich copper-binding protein CopC [Jiangella mangrovi]